MSEAEAAESTEQVDNQEPDDNPVNTGDHPTSAKHMSKDEWVSKGNDAADYKTPEQFDEAGKWIKITKKMQRDMDEMKQSMSQAHEDQIKGLNQLHNAQLQSKVQQLEAKRDAAIDDFDKVGAREAQTEIDKAYAAQPAPIQQPVAQPTKDPAIAEWERNNPDILSNPEKLAFANARTNSYLEGGLSMPEALASLDGDLARTYPATNPNRNAPANSEMGSGPGQKSTPKALTMGDLTSDEASIWKHSSSMWSGDEKKFLQAVTNDRKG